MFCLVIANITLAYDYYTTRICASGSREDDDGDNNNGDDDGNDDDDDDVDDDFSAKELSLQRNAMAMVIAEQRLSSCGAYTCCGAIGIEAPEMTAWNVVMPCRWPRDHVCSGDPSRSSSTLPLAPAARNSFIP